MSHQSEAAITPVKSQGDDRSYRVIRLENDLTVMLVSDPETDKSGAAMDVHVGHFSDPDETPGLAHFLEHMLFLGTEKYPDENSYSAFLNAHGGSSNAYTGMENTNYYFDVVQQHLEESLDRFAQFFISPLFTISATDREMQAVHNENAKNLLSDSWRLFQLLKTTSNPKHPFSKFGTGNLSTLRDTPKEKNVDVRQYLINFHQTYYSASIMKLCILGREPLDTLEKWARDKFSAIKNTKREPPVFGEDALGSQSISQVFNVVPIKDIRTLSILWPMAATQHLFASKPTNVLSHLLGHEGKGSVLSLLKTKGWANGLSSGLNQSTTSFSTFGVSIDLTEPGLDHADDIISIVYAYIHLMQKATDSEWREHFTEVSEVAQMGFTFKSKETPFHYVSGLSSDMQKYPPHQFLSGPWLYETFDLPSIRHFLQYLRPDNMRMQVVSRSFAGKTDKSEQWYGSEYNITPLTQPQLTRFQQPDSIPVDQLHLPRPNPFIATDFTIKHQQAADRKENTDPMLLNREQTPAPLPADVWFKADTTYLKPKGIVIIKMTSAVAYDSPTASVLTNLYTKLLEDSLNEFSYDAEVAGLSYSLSALSVGLQLYLRGYNHKLHILAHAIVEKMKYLEIKQERFVLIKEQITRSLRNFRLEQPYSHAAYEHTYSIENTLWKHHEKLRVIDGLTTQDLIAFIPRLLQQLHVEVFVHGNMVREEALNMANMLHTTLAFQPLLPSQIPELRVVKLKHGNTYIQQFTGLNEQDENSAVITTYQLGPDSIDKSTRADLFAHLINEPAFNQLRTKEQLGYLVWSGIQENKGVLFFRVIIQSSDRPADELDDRVEAFLEQYRDMLSSMSEEEFKKNLDAVIAKKEEKDKTLSQEANRHWAEISTHRFQFDRVAREVAVLRSLTLADVVAFYDRYIRINTPTRRKYTVQSFANKYVTPEQGHKATIKEGRDNDKKEQDGEKEPEKEKEASTKEVNEPLRPPPVDQSTKIYITDGIAFKRSMPLYPHLI